MAFNWGPLPPHFYDWGDFHKFAVIFFTFFGSGVILAAIFVVLYLACIRSWWASFREDVRETHRSFHPWPPGSAKWQLQQFLRGSPPPSTEKKDVKMASPSPAALAPLTVAVPSSPNALPWSSVEAASPSYARPRPFSPPRAGETLVSSPGYSLPRIERENVALEAVTVRTTTTTRRTTTLSPVRPPPTNV